MFPSLLPKSAPFFAMLLEQNKDLCSMAELLRKLLDNYEDRYAILKEIVEKEAEADTLERRIVRSLSQTFITPIDREDILRITQAQEECIDNILSLASRISVFDFSEIVYPVSNIAGNIIMMASLTTEMLVGLTKRHDCHKTRAFQGVRGECDSLLSVGIAELMDLTDGVKKENVVNLLKWMQIFDRLELLLRRVTDLSQDIEEAVLKNV